MPKVVDHERRRRELIEATWRVVQRDGVEAASVRDIAAEAGCSPGSLRYYFPTQAGLIGLAMEAVADRVRARIEALEPRTDPRETVERLLEEVLPLDAERRVEVEVWLAFVYRAQVDSHLAAARDEAHRALRLLVHRCLALLARSSPTPVEWSLERETTRLHALLDGLAIHAVTSPGTATPRRLRTALRSHLDSLVR